LKLFFFQIPKDIMASIYKLVAERRDRNQSIKRRRNNRNINLFKDSIEEVQFRRPEMYRNATVRHRTVSDQQTIPDSLPPPGPAFRRPTSDILMVNIKNQIKDVDVKVDALTKKLDELCNYITLINKN